MMTENLKIITKVLGIVGTNCYFAVNMTTNQVIIIDPADNAGEISAVIEQNGYKPEAVFLTHGHFDHILAADAVRNKYNIPIYAGSKERELLEDSSVNLSEGFGMLSELKADYYLEDEDIIDMAGFTIKALYTPGHTLGSMCYYLLVNHVLFSGDTLFCESVGRSDFPTGSASQLIRSIKDKLFVLPEEVAVYPGHGDATSIGHEKHHNPFCQ